jgi:hypothetical protein
VITGWAGWVITPDGVDRCTSDRFDIGTHWELEMRRSVLAATIAGGVFALAVFIVGSAAVATPDAPTAPAVMTGEPTPTPSQESVTQDQGQSGRPGQSGEWGQNGEWGQHGQWEQNGESGPANEHHDELPER